jgi:membrane protein implicated in regulation of membrane protease activity
MLTPGTSAPAGSTVLVESVDGATLVVFSEEF